MKVVIIGVIVGAIILAGYWELRRADRAAARAAFNHAKRTVPAQAPVPSDEDALDRLIQDAGWMCNPVDVDLIDDYIAIWAAKYGKEQR